MKLDPQTVLRNLTVSGDGWRIDRIMLRNGPRRAFEGLIDPNGNAWEIFDVPEKPGLLREFARRIVNQGTAGYQQAIVTVAGRQLLAERFYDILKPWDGLDLVGPWRDDSCDGMPWQHYVEGSFQGQRVALYIHWRGSDPWTGHAVHLEPSDDITLLYKYPWSPNLLPADKPEPERATDLLSLLDAQPYDPWITEDELDRAKRVIYERADLWLCKNVNDPTTWLPKTRKVFK